MSIATGVRLMASVPARSLAVLLTALMITITTSVVPSGRAADTGAPVSGYRVVNVFPHDPAAYTQGLLFHDGFLYESTGLHGQSTLRKVKLETGEVVQRRRIDRAHFAEGLAEWKGQLVQLTWQSRVAFVYRLSDFEPLRTFSYAGEGWGLTHDGRRFILSDGTSTLRFLDPETFRETGRITVTDGGQRVANLNELEYVRGEVLANIWYADRVARISPESGRVTGWIDLGGLLPSTFRRNPDDVLNGIAYDAKADRLFVTGKLWPRLFEIDIVPRP
jgi:glutamine cyclotransferase